MSNNLNVLFSKECPKMTHIVPYLIFFTWLFYMSCVFTILIFVLNISLLFNSSIPNFSKLSILSFGLTNRARGQYSPNGSEKHRKAISASSRSTFVVHMAGYPMLRKWTTGNEFDDISHMCGSLWLNTIPVRMPSSNCVGIIQRCGKRVRFHEKKKRLRESVEVDSLELDPQTEQFIFSGIPTI